MDMMNFDLKKSINNEINRRESQDEDFALIFGYELIIDCWRGEKLQQECHGWLVLYSVLGTIIYIKEVFLSDFISNLVNICKKIREDEYLCRITYDTTSHQYKSEIVVKKEIENGKWSFEEIPELIVYDEDLRYSFLKLDSRLELMTLLHQKPNSDNFESKSKVLPKLLSRIKGKTFRKNSTND